MPLILTERLELIPATASIVGAALEGPAALAKTLGVEVPPSWPPEYLDPPSLAFILTRLGQGPEQADWWLHFVVLKAGDEPRTLIGSAGYCGPPTADGTVEVGYGIVSDRRRLGFASEAVRGLIAQAYTHPSVRRIIAHTLPSLAGSIGVLQKCGFRLLPEEGPEPGVIRFELMGR